MIVRNNNRLKKTLGLLILLTLTSIQIINLNNLTYNVNVSAEITTWVLFDESHFPYAAVNTSNMANSFGGFDEFAGQLEINGFSIETIDEGQSVTQTVLDSYDILVIASSYTNYTEQEINEIGAWVRAGGSLFLITDWVAFVKGTYDLAAHFHFMLPVFDGLKDIDDNVSHLSTKFALEGDNIINHTITQGVSRIEVYGVNGIMGHPAGANPLIFTDDDDTTTWLDPGLLANHVPVLVALEGGYIENGKMVVITDCDMFGGISDSDLDGTPNYYDSDNEILAMNIMNWLKIPYSTTSVNTKLIFVSALFTLAVFIIFKKKRK